MKESWDDLFGEIPASFEARINETLASLEEKPRSGAWEDLFGEVPASFEARISETLASLEEKPKIRRFRFPAGSLIAAVLAVAVLGGTALATNLFGLSSVTVADPYATPEAVGDAIALQGEPESPEFKANAEWMEYLAGYDADGAIYARVRDSGTALDEKYDLYPTVYTQEMADKLEELAAAHSLKLHTSLQEFFSEQDLYSLAGSDAFLKDCAAVYGYVYEDGSFQANGTIVADKCYEFQLGRYRKGTFSETTVNVGDVNTFEEWLYTTASGVDVQLSMGKDRCVLMADLPDSFVAVYLLGGTDGNTVFMPEPVSREDLEAFADLIDFSALD